MSCELLLTVEPSICLVSYCLLQHLHLMHLKWLRGLNISVYIYISSSSSYWTVSLLYVLHLTGLSHCSMCFILLDCLTALCASSYWTVSLLYVLSVCVCVCVCV